MSLPNPETVVTEERLNEFYTELLPYLGGRADAGFTPVGTIIAVMGNSAPTNYLACNGQTVNIADYPELAAYFKAQFGSANYFGGNGTTTFNICDLRGEFLRGTGTNVHSGEGNGAAVGTHQAASQIIRLGCTSGTSAGDSSIRIYGSSINTWGSNFDAAVEGTHFKTVKQDSVITPSSGDNKDALIKLRPTNTSVLFCIATKNIYLNPSLDYSTDEKVVGTWIDGKPIYQKTAITTAPTAADVNKTIMEIPNFKDLISLNGSVTLDNGAVVPLNSTTNNNPSNTGVCTFWSSTALVMQVKYARALNQPVIVTTRYTKTTD